MCGSQVSWHQQLRLAYRLSESVNPGKLPERKENARRMSELLTATQIRCVKVHLPEPQKAAEKGIVEFTICKDQQVFAFNQDEDVDVLDDKFMLVSTFMLSVTHRIIDEVQQVGGDQGSSVGINVPGLAAGGGPLLRHCHLKHILSSKAAGSFTNSGSIKKWLQLPCGRTLCANPCPAGLPATFSSGPSSFRRPRCFRSSCRRVRRKSSLTDHAVWSVIIRAAGVF